MAGHIIQSGPLYHIVGVCQAGALHADISIGSMVEQCNSEDFLRRWQQYDGLKKKRYSPYQGFSG